ncbi:MAG: hypothetical protein IJ799_06405 [Bacteroidales bacterium]|nr:hypothetical protein [Bacteroidales bacterium]
MDIVITYVDGLDPAWQKVYEETVGVSMNQKRFRDWGTLPYLLRGIEKYMPFIRNVWLVVAMDSQVPSWVDRERVKVVLHRDIIPEHLLPLFNAGSIEIFLPRITGLDEEFLYFNDDFFPLRPSRPSDFFRDGRICTGYKAHLFATSLFKKRVWTSDRAARRFAGLRPSPVFHRPQHICSPMLRSVCLDLYEREAQEICASVTPLRTPDNFNQCLYMDYLYYTGHALNRPISRKFFSMATHDIDGIRRFMLAPGADFMCVNDVNMPEERYHRSRQVLLDTFARILPEKSSFEL